MAEMNLEKMVPVEEIIRSHFESTGELDLFDAAYDSIAQAIKSGNTRIFRFENTLLIYTIVGDGVAEVHLMSIDAPQVVVSAIKDFYKAFKISGFKTLYTTVEDPQVVRLIKMAGIPVESKEIYDDNGQSIQQITIEVK